MRTVASVGPNLAIFFSSARKRGLSPMSCLRPMVSLEALDHLLLMVDRIKPAPKPGKQVYRAQWGYHVVVSAVREGFLDGVGIVGGQYDDQGPTTSVGV